ncbi:hypothetical protein AYO44_04375 [Planctomycetaceae bacterium SCGC AG-212-F19]|nr:hypothetical protein AYO44_04375 [Planctomycetaceae bacterium SCGC AG-212-F19]
MGFARTTFLYFSPKVVTFAVSLAMVPITTACLGVEDMGHIAILTAYGGLVVALATAGFNYMSLAHFIGLTKEEKPAYVTTLVTTGLVLIAGLVSLAGCAWGGLHPFLSYFENTTGSEVALVIGMAGALACWSQVEPILILESRARWVAIISIIATVASAVATVVGLYVLGIGRKAVLAGALASALVLAVGGLAGVRHYLRPVWSRRWLTELIQLSLLRAPQTLFDPLASMAERWMVVNWISLGALGVYTHAQTYRTGLIAALGAVAQTLQPISLAEARQDIANFPRTRRAIHGITLALSLASLGCALFGKEILGLMTHGKFVAAAPFVTCWIIYLTMQQTAREDVSILLTANCRVFFSTASILTQIANLVVMLCLIPVWGLWGIVAAVFTEIALFRLLLRWRAARLRTRPFHDGPVLRSLAVTLAALGAQVFFADDLAMRSAAIALLAIAYASAERSSMVKFSRAAVNKFAQWSHRPDVLLPQP